MSSFKPMLAPHEIPDFDTLPYPLLASTKFDGFRCMSQDGLKSRTLKPIVNQFLQERFAGLPWGVDGELIQGLKQDNGTFKRTSRIATKSDRPLDFFGDTVRLRVFDKFDPTAPFDQRLAAAVEACKGFEFAVPVPHIVIGCVNDLELFESQSLEHGYEGVMLRSISGPYKQGRATFKQGWILKVKRFADAEATIVSAYEEQENQNEEFTNELGRTARSSAKAGKVAKGQLGGFHCVGLNGIYAGVQFDVSSSAIDHDDRKALWAQRTEQAGKILTYKFFPKGSDEKPRHPIFKGFRAQEDI